MKDKNSKKAVELIKHYYDVVYPYIGSSYMTGDECPRIKFKYGKAEALFLVQNILDAMPSNASDLEDYVELFEVINNMEQDYCDWENI